MEPTTPTGGTRVSTRGICASDATSATTPTTSTSGCEPSEAVPPSRYDDRRARRPASQGHPPLPLHSVRHPLGRMTWGPSNTPPTNAGGRATATAPADHGAAPSIARSTRRATSSTSAPTSSAANGSTRPCVDRRSPAGPRLPRSTRIEPHFLTAEQVAALAAAVRDEYRFLVVLAAYTGLRPGELCGLLGRTAAHPHPSEDFAIR